LAAGIPAASKRDNDAVFRMTLIPGKLVSDARTAAA
jgi:hypothetical protein